MSEFVAVETIYLRGGKQVEKPCEFAFNDREACFAGTGVSYVEDALLEVPDHKENAKPGAVIHERDLEFSHDGSSGMNCSHKLYSALMKHHEKLKANGQTAKLMTTITVRGLAYQVHMVLKPV